MTQLTTNLWRKECNCKCGCGMNTIDYEIVKYFQMICDECTDRLDKKCVATITSGNRCKEHNEKVGGKPNSRHTYSQAIDFRVRGFTSEDLLNIAKVILPKDKYFCYKVTDLVIHVQTK